VSGIDKHLKLLQAGIDYHNRAKEGFYGALLR